MLDSLERKNGFSEIGQDLDSLPYPFFEWKIGISI